MATRAGRRMRAATIASLFAIAASGVLGGPAAAAPVEVEVDGLTIIADDENVSGGATVDNYTGTSPSPAIPATVDIGGVTYPVTTIGDFAFGFRGITSVTIPNGVTTINYAGFVANSLTQIAIPASVTSIADDAFSVNGLVAVSLEGAPPSIGSFAFGETGEIGPLVSYPWRFDAAIVSGGYTSPAWQGYRSQAIATVTFDSAGGLSTPAAEAVVVGTRIDEPAAPTRVGFDFVGWAIEPGGTTTWDFGAPLTIDALTSATTNSAETDLLLTARWAPVASELADTGFSHLGWLTAAALCLVAAGLALERSRRRLATVLATR